VRPALPGIVVDDYVPVREIVDGGTRLQQAMAAKGIVPTGAADLAAAHPELWRSPAAAKKWIGRHGPITGDILLIGSISKASQVMARYRREDARGPASTVYIDATRHPDPHRALESVIGPVSGFEIVPAAAPPDSTTMFALDVPPLLDAAPPPPRLTPPRLAVVRPVPEPRPVPSYDAVFGDELDPFSEDDQIEAIRRWMRPHQAHAEAAHRSLGAGGALF
jgi:hypothetical protein